jgi:hypothetical protein
MSENSEKLTCGPSREKYWQEMTPEEKLEVAKDCILSLKREILSIKKTIGSYEQHSHGSDGRLLIEYRSRYMKPEQYRESYCFERLLTEKQRP